MTEHPQRRIYGAEGDPYAIRPGHEYVQLFGGPLDGQLLNITGLTLEQRITGVHLITRAAFMGQVAGRPMHQPVTTLTNTGSGRVTCPEATRSPARTRPCSEMRPLRCSALPRVARSPVLHAPTCPRSRTAHRAPLEPLPGCCFGSCSAEVTPAAMLRRSLRRPQRAHPSRDLAALC